MKKWLIWTLLFAGSCVLFYFYGQDVWQFLSSGSREDYQIVRDYLALLASWPIIVGILGFYFLSRFSVPISSFIDRMHSLKAPGIEFSSEDQLRKSESDRGVQEAVEKAAEPGDIRDTSVNREQIRQIINEFTGQNDQIETLKNIASRALDRAEVFEFAYLNLFLVPNSKIALMVLNRQDTPKVIFLSQMQVSDQVDDPVKERHAILGALVGNGLVEDNGTMLKITEKGRRFLDSVGLSQADKRANP